MGDHRASRVVSAARYLEGVVVGIVCIGALACGARRLRGRNAPFYDGPVALIADRVMVLALLIVVLQAVGVVASSSVRASSSAAWSGALAWETGANRASPSRRWRPGRRRHRAVG